MEIFMLSAIGIISRLAPHAPNMTAVGALSLFSANKFGVKKAVIILLCTMLLSDLFLGLHGVMWATYGSFLVAIFFGRYAKNYIQIAGATLASAVIFYLVTNFAVWATGTMYAKTFSGLIECYVMAIPFFRNSLIGDFLYSFLLFGAYEMVLRIKREKAYIRRTNS